MPNDAFSRMNASSAECIREIGPLTAILKRNAVDEGYPMQKSMEALEFIVRELNLGVENEDWNFYKQFGRVRREFLKILERVITSADYYCDKDFGFGERPASPKGEAEKIGELLLEPFRLARKQFFQSIPEEMRDKEWKNCKRSVRSLITSYNLCMAAKVPELKEV